MRREIIAIAAVLALLSPAAAEDGFIRGSATGAAGGDLSGLYPNPTVAKVNGGTPPTGIWKNNPPVAAVAGVDYLTSAVTSVICGTGLSGGTITTTGTCAINLSTVANSLGGDVAMNNVSNFFDGPSVAQGTSGTWLATGSVIVQDTSASAGIQCKLWDGTTVIAAGAVNTQGATANNTIALSGVLATPAANIKISCKDPTSANGLIKFNVTGTSKDSTLTAVRIN